MVSVREIEELNDTSFNDAFQQLWEAVSEYRTCTRVQVMELFDTLFLLAVISVLPAGEMLPDQGEIREELLSHIKNELPEILTVFDRLQEAEVGA